MTNTNMKLNGEYDAKEFKRAWTHWYVQLGHICDTREDWDLYKQVEAFILKKILEEKQLLEKKELEEELSRSATRP